MTGKPIINRERNQATVKALVEALSIAQGHLDSSAHTGIHDIIINALKLAEKTQS